MKEFIFLNIEDPEKLEKLYRSNKVLFKKEFNAIYSEIEKFPAAGFWNERLNFEQQEISWGAKNELSFIVVLSLLAGIIAKIPEILTINTEFFYTRNIGFIVFPFLAIYFSWKYSLNNKRALIAFLSMTISLLWINFFPANSSSDTLVLSCIHLPLFLWVIVGFVFSGDKLASYERRLEYLRFNGDLIVMVALLLISGAILTGITIGLFNMIGSEITEFYFRNIVILGLAASPIVGTYLVQSNPHLVNKVSPVIAKIFTPLVLITLVIYLLAIVVSGKDPYNDREFLMIFNALLVGVMALIFFSIAETSRSSKSNSGMMVLLALSVVTIIVNGIALSAIVFRLYEWGITPNRLAILGGNILMFAHLLVITKNIFKFVKDKVGLNSIEKSIAIFLPVYALWTIVVTFIFPLIFRFK